MTESRIERPSDSDLRDFKVALHSKRDRATGELYVDVAIMRAHAAPDDFHIEDVTADYGYLDADVLVLRIDFTGQSDEPWTRQCHRHSVADGAAFRSVLVMYGPKGQNGTPVALELIK